MIWLCRPDVDSGGTVVVGLKRSLENMVCDIGDKWFMILW
jgi:hypothetical protein